MRDGTVDSTFSNIPFVRNIFSNPQAILYYSILLHNLWMITTPPSPLSFNNSAWMLSTPGALPLLAFLLHFQLLREEERNIWAIFKILLFFILLCIIIFGCISTQYLPSLSFRSW